MTDIQIPKTEELLLPCLKAVIELGGSGTRDEIDALTLDLADVSDEQRSVTFDSDAPSAGPKVVQRLGWARSNLKRAGALESAGWGRWAVTEVGREFAKLPEEQATGDLQAAVQKAYAHVEPSVEDFASWRSAADSGEPESMSVREFVRMWGVNRRFTATVDRIQKSLAVHGMATSPSFTSGSLDSYTAIVAAGPHDDPGTGEQTETSTTGFREEPAGLAVSNIPSATRGICSVDPQANLETAQSIMRANDYSQLAVMVGKRTIKGALSWESIAKAKISDANATLKRCTDPHPRVVRLSDRLLDVVPYIADADFVFVKNDHEEVTGIITASDLADQFASLSRPFLLVGEIERVLRTAINRQFSPQELSETVDPNDDRDIDGAESLTLGEVQRLLEIDSQFGRLGWLADRKVFIYHLESVRGIRNEVMHFSPDPLSDDNLKQLRNFLRFIMDLDEERQVSMA